MRNTRIPSQEQLRQLYSKGYSMTEIAKQLQYSPHKIVYWMRKYGIERRTLSDALYIKLNPQGDPFQIKTNLTQEEIFLFGIGIGIYWGEGEKVTKHAIRVANSDPDMIKTFIRFLLIICGLDPKKISFSLICFHDSNKEQVVNFWANQLQTSPEKFGKIVSIPTQGKGTYKRKSAFGVCTVTASNIKLKAWIMSEINRIRQYAQIVQWENAILVRWGREFDSRSGLT